MQKQAHCGRDDQARSGFGVNLYERTFFHAFLDQCGEIFMITTVGGDACLPDFFIAAGLQPKLQKHRQTFARGFDNVRVGFGDLQEHFGHGLVARGFDTAVNGRQPQVKQRKE